MSLTRMWDNDILTKDDYALAFQQIRDGKGTLSSQVILRYMKHDPVNAVYLQTEAAKLMRETLSKNLAFSANHGVSSPFVLWLSDDNTEKQILRRSGVLPVFDKLMLRSNPIHKLSSEYLVYQECLFCAAVGTSLVTRMSFQREMTPLYAMFDTTHEPTMASVNHFINMFHRQELITSEYIMGLCPGCYRRCNECNIGVPMPQVSFAALESYYLERACVACGGDSIAKVLPPKPNPKDLRLYRMKFSKDFSLKALQKEEQIR